MGRYFDHSYIVCVWVCFYFVCGVETGDTCSEHTCERGTIEICAGQPTVVIMERERRDVEREREKEKGQGRGVNHYFDQ